MANKTAIQGWEDTLGVVNGTAGIYNTSALVAGIVAAAVAGIEVVIWEMAVPPQQKIRWGSGLYGHPNQGGMWFATMIATTSFSSGQLLLQSQNALRTKSDPIMRVADSRLHSGVVTSLATAQLNDYNTMIHLPMQGKRIVENSLMQLRYTIGVAHVSTSAGFCIPITRFNT